MGTEWCPRAGRQAEPINRRKPYLGWVPNGVDVPCACTCDGGGAQGEGLLGRLKSLQQTAASLANYILHFEMIGKCVVMYRSFTLYICRIGDVAIPITDKSSHRSVGPISGHGDAA
jgi:hypothetical protein